jgi:hypothetical protein
MKGFPGTRGQIKQDCRLQSIKRPVEVNRVPGFPEPGFSGGIRVDRLNGTESQGAENCLKNLDEHISPASLVT